VLLAAVAVVVACSGAGSSGGYAVAGAALGGTIVASGINRAVTSDCWAQCSPGYACDRGRGTCVRAECVPECAPGEHCVIEHDGRFRCMDSLGTARLGAPVSGSVATAPAQSDASAGPRALPGADAGDAAAD